MYTFVRLGAKYLIFFYPASKPNQVWGVSLEHNRGQKEIRLVQVWRGGLLLMGSGEDNWNLELESEKLKRKKIYLRENFKYYFADFVRKGGTPPPFTDKIFSKKKVTDLGGTPPLPLYGHSPEKSS